MNRQRRKWCGPSFASQMKVLYNRCVHWRVLTVCAGIQQLNDRIRQVLKSSGSTTFSKIVNKWNGHRSPSPYTQTSQSIPTLALKLMGMGGPTPGRLPPAKGGHVNRNLTHLALRRILSFPSHLVVTLRRPTRDLKVPTCQAKLLLIFSPTLHSPLTTFLPTPPSLSSYHFELFAINQPVSLFSSVLFTS